MVALFITFIIWVTLSAIAYKEGEKRQIGGLIALLLSLFLSPVIGLLFVALSDKLEDPYRRPQSTTDDDIKNSLIANELLKLKQAMEKGEISQLEYYEQQEKLLQRFK